MILYALVSDTSIGYLFLGGVIPGLVLGLFLMVYNVWVARVRNFPRDEAVPFKELPRITARAFPALLLPVILLSGIYGGATTPTEAAAVAAAYALFISTVLYRSLSWRELYEVVLDAARATSVVGLIIASALVLNYLWRAKISPIWWPHRW
jgi:tripartite ATP-independent transporter DctM subunit